MNSEALTDLVVEALDDVKAKDIVKLDVRNMTVVTDYMVIASGTSNRHVKALVDNVAEKAKAAGRRPIGIEGEDGVTLFEGLKNLLELILGNTNAGIRDSHLQLLINDLGRYFDMTRFSKFNGIANEII